MSNSGIIVHSSVETHLGLNLSVIQYQPTDRPIEDRFSITPDFESQRLIIGVYDGHGGTATAEHLSRVLPPNLLSSSVNSRSDVFQAIDDAMIRSFIKDHHLFAKKSRDWVKNAQLIKSGCTALTFDIDIQTLTASIANAGDCRAIVLRYRSTSPLATPSSLKLSTFSDEIAFHTTDLNAKSLTEQERLRHEHPNEDFLIVSERLFGKIMTTRGFGDGYYKLPRGINGWSHRKYIDVLSSVEAANKVPLNQQYDIYFYGYKTPPYLTARPELATFQLTRGDLVILATDGLWDILSNEDVYEVLHKGLGDGSRDFAASLLDTAKAKRPPGDDVTILTLSI